MAQTPLQQILLLLKKRHGEVKPPLWGRDPLPFLYLEAVGYLCTDDKRLAAFTALRDRGGLAPKAALAAPMPVLATICRIGGLFPDKRAERLKEIAALVLDEFNGDLTSVLSWDYATARKALQKFPMIGEPGADRILMLCGYSGVFGFQQGARASCAPPPPARTCDVQGLGAALRGVPVDGELRLVRGARAMIRAGVRRAPAGRRGPTRFSGPSLRTHSRAPSTRRSRDRTSRFQRHTSPSW